MKNTLRTLGVAGLALWLGPSALPQANDSPDDGYEREPKNREVKDALEGKAPPPLVVDGWMNTDGRPLTLDSLRGKVVVLDFWGTW